MLLLVEYISLGYFCYTHHAMIVWLPLDYVYFIFYFSTLDFLIFDSFVLLFICLYQIMYEYIVLRCREALPAAASNEESESRDDNGGRERQASNRSGDAKCVSGFFDGCQ
jgi:hypothetical protein